MKRHDLSHKLSRSHFHRLFAVTGILTVFGGTILSVSAQTIIGPDDDKSVLIDAPESDRIEGEEDVDGVTIEVTPEGSIVEADSPTILGRGPEWLIQNAGLLERTDEGFAVRLENGGTLRNSGTIRGDVFLGDEDATLSIAPGYEITGDVDPGAGDNVLELAPRGSPNDPVRTEYDGEFDQFPELHVRAPNTIWQLTGDQTYSAGTEIFAGVLQTADPLTSDVVVHEDGVMVSTGTLDGDIDVSGTFAAGAVDETGTLTSPEGNGILTVDGGVTLRDGSNFNVIGGDTWLDATGAVVIEEGGDAGVTLVVNGSELELGDEFQVLEAGDLEGTFEQIETVGARPFLLSELTYGDNLITAATTRNEEALLAAAQTNNQRAMARTLADFDPSPEIEEDFRSFFTEADFQNFGEFTDSMSGEIIASGAVASVSFGQGFRQTIYNTKQHRPDPTAQYFSTPPGSTPPQEQQEEEEESDLALWTRALGIWGSLDRGEEMDDADYRLAGILLGIDFISTDASQAGVAFSYGDSRTSRGSDRVNGDIYHAALYGTHEGDLLIYDGMVGFGFHDLESQRVVQPFDERTEASYNGNEFFASVQATMPVELDGMTVMPLAGLDYTHFRQGSFSESGNWGLEGDSVTMNSLRASFGMRFLTEYITARNGHVVPEFRIGYAQTLFDRDASFSASFQEDQGGNQFTTRSAGIEGGEFSVGTGVMVQPGRWESTSLFFDYDFAVPRHHAVSAGIQVNF